MGLEINADEEERNVSRIAVDRRLWLNADKSKLVEDGDPDAAFFWAGPGQEVDADEAKALNYKARGTKASDTSDEERVCDVCGKTAKSAAGLAAHQRSHDED